MNWISLANKFYFKHCLWKKKLVTGTSVKLKLLMSSVGFPGGSAGKESTWNTEDLGSISGLGASPAEGNLLQYSGLENSVDCIVSGVAKTQCLLQKTSLTEWKEKSEKIFVKHISNKELASKYVKDSKNSTTRKQATQ